MKKEKKQLRIFKILLILFILSATMLLNNSCGLPKNTVSGASMSYAKHLKSSDKSNKYPCSDYVKTKR